MHPDLIRVEQYEGVPAGQLEREHMEEQASSYLPAEAVCDTLPLLQPLVLLKNTMYLMASKNLNK